MTITLLVNNTALGEVVVVGYGTAKKGSLTGAVSTVGAKLSRTVVLLRVRWLHCRARCRE